MKYYIVSVHAGINIKPYVIELLKIRGYEVEDLGCYSNDRVDYPDYAHKVADAVSNDPKSKGILICGSGIGMSLSANKHKGIRAALCHDHYTAKMARLHNDANILCFGERIVAKGIIEEMIDVWCQTEFEGDRHINRVAIIEL